MTRFLVFLVIGAVCVGLSEVAGKKSPRPNGQKPLSKEDKKKLPRFVHNERHRGVGVIPDSFDSREKWPGCKSISTIRDQGQCGTCWAVSSASVLSDRLCIASGQKMNDFVSAAMIAGCTDPTQSGDDNCNVGGDAANAYKLAAMKGVCTGGELNSGQGCQPYPVGNKAIPLTCSTKCSNPASLKKSTADDKLVVDSYWATYTGEAGDTLTPAQIKTNVHQMQVDILAHGPITAAIQCDSEFGEWIPGNGPYSGPSPAAEAQGGHAVRIIGWGVDAKTKKPYWKVANSWGVSEGDKGVFNVEMGKNVMGIESTISAPIVTMPNTCGKFCGPIDQIVRFQPSDASGRVFAFSGNCTTEVKISATGAITPLGLPQPTSKMFVGSTGGPISGYLVSGGKVFLVNPAVPPATSGTAAACTPPGPRDIKISCAAATATAGAGAQATTPKGDKYVYYNKDGGLYQFPAGSNSGSGQVGVIKDDIPKVSAIQDIDGKNLLVCGTAAGGAACGVIDPNNQAAWKVKPSPLPKC